MFSFHLTRYIMYNIYNYIYAFRTYDTKALHCFYIFFKYYNYLYILNENFIVCFNFGIRFLLTCYLPLNNYLNL